jgi:hypothetical protein
MTPEGRSRAGARAGRPAAEADLYQPIKRFLVAQGYTVRGEVNHCDIAASKGDDLVVIELKRAFGTALLVQATKRQRMADSVYVAVPRPRAPGSWHDKRHLLRRLELGLIWVSFGRKEPRVEIVFHPVPFQRQKRKRAKIAVLTEMNGRSGDFNVGGTHSRKLVTAYRENAIHIACLLETLGPLTPAQLRAHGTGPKTQSILYSDFYGWFERVARGVYALRPQGRAALKSYSRIARRYRPAAASAVTRRPAPGSAGPRAPAGGSLPRGSATSR